MSEVSTELNLRLGRETVATIWSDDELDQYIQEGYDDLCRRTGCLWATDVLPDFAFAFSYTQPFEFDFFVADTRIAGLAQFTSTFERDYIDNADGPANHTQHWEYNLGYQTITEVSGLADLPDDLYEVERATWNTRRIETWDSRKLEWDDSRYELNKGNVEAYTQDKDGIARLRKWRVPSGAYVPYSLDDETKYWGILVQITEVSAAAPLFTWGDFVQVPAQHMMGDPWGVIVAVYKETGDVRIEYQRRGRELSDEQDFEIPERYQKYVRHYAQARAFECEGDGQDLELAAHYQSRYDAGIARMIKRKEAMLYQRKTILGGGIRRSNRKPLAQLPYTYGERR